jgi:hypothetical protein
MTASVWERYNVEAVVKQLGSSVYTLTDLSVCDTQEFRFYGIVWMKSLADHHLIQL